jgi:catechol 2,3-dioxygenase-like lactoylglutathione lyase family enzyme
VITGIHHFALTVHDMERSLAFYCGLFGLEVASDRTVERDYVEQITAVPGAHVRLVHLSGYGLCVELLEYLEPRGAERARSLPDAGSAHICFLTDDLDAEVARLRAAGATFRSLPVVTTSGPNRGGRGIYIEDPEGNAVEVVQVAATGGRAMG